MKCETGNCRRLFLAIEIDERIKRRVLSVINDLDKSPAIVKWVKIDNIHLTLVFLGSISDAMVGGITEGVDACAGATKRFNCQFYGLGYFGGNRVPRVIWAGIRGGVDALTGLQRRLVSRLGEIGVGMDKRPFTPHLTLGRVKTRKGLELLTHRVEHFKDTDMGSMEIRSISLIESFLEPQGARYSQVHVSSFAG